MAIPNIYESNGTLQSVEARSVALFMSGGFFITCSKHVNVQTYMLELQLSVEHSWLEHTMV